MLHLYQALVYSACEPCLELDLTLEMGDTSKDSTLILGLYTFCLANPGSITYTMPSMVKEVSAMLVDTTILRPAMPFFPGAGACTDEKHARH